MRPQIDGVRLERRGSIRRDWGPDDTRDRDKLYWYTGRGRAALTA